MKVFRYNIHSGRIGSQIADIPLCHATSNDAGIEVALPPLAGHRDTQFRVATHAEYLDRKPIEFDEPVAFCTGHLCAGEDCAWHWVILLPASITIEGAPK